MFINILEPFTNPNNVELHHGTFSIDLVMLLVIGVIIIPYVFYNIRLLVPYPVKSNLKLHDYYIIIILLVYLVIGIYQQYFWTKQNKLRKEKIIPKTKLDKYIYNLFGENDNWVYIYNFIYYFIFGFVIISIRDYKHFAILILGGIAMMTGLSIIWYLFPNDVLSRMKTNKYFLKKTQVIDDEGNNACPSAHVVFAMYSFYLLKNIIGYLPALLIPILISISCMATTQHVSTDIILGVIYSILFYNLILKNIFPSIFK
jgi:hypothetical protein